MRDNDRKDWSNGLQYIQLQKNSRLHTGIGGTPYETLFVVPPIHGIGMFGIPGDDQINFETEEQLQEALETVNIISELYKSKKNF